MSKVRPRPNKLTKPAYLFDTSRDPKVNIGQIYGNQFGTPFKPVVGIQMRSFNPQQGDGIIRDVIDKVLPTRKNFPPKVRKIIKDNENKMIKSITVCRNPVQSYVTKALNLLSLGKLEEKVHEMEYDDLYHLFMLVGLDDGTTLLVEKNSVVNMKKVDPNYFAKQSMNVPITRNVAFGEMIDNAVQAVGPNIYLYDAQTNNCQVFINNLLQYSGLLNPELSSFINQDIVQALSTSPEYTKIIANLATEASAKLDTFINGQGKKKPVRKSAGSKTNANTTARKRPVTRKPRKKSK